ncbi:MAG: hypothetical protein ACYSWU_07070, partial [Planctomycetota bacterium]
RQNMRRLIIPLVVVSCALAGPAAALGERYTVVDLGTLGGPQSEPWDRSCQARGINAAGQVVGLSSIADGSGRHAFRTAPGMPINPATDDLGTLGGAWSAAWGINAAGQVVGWSQIGGGARHAFRTAAGMPINPATDDLGTLGGTESAASAINAVGQVVGRSWIAGDTAAYHAFRTAPGMPMNPATDDLGTLGGTSSWAFGINDAGQVVGRSQIGGGSAYHAFRTAAGMPINPVTGSPETPLLPPSGLRPVCRSTRPPTTWAHSAGGRPLPTGSTPPGRSWARPGSLETSRITPSSMTAHGCGTSMT